MTFSHAVYYIINDYYSHYIVVLPVFTILKAIITNLQNDFLPKNFKLIFMMA